nr:hypothetical protein BaRGS_008306 [Batillaria attramentaria]
MSPSPVKVPGDLTVSGALTLNRLAAGNMKLDLTIERYVGFFWVTVPCISDVGSWLNKPLLGHVMVKLNIQKKHGGFFGSDLHIPCISNIGSCVAQAIRSTTEKPVTKATNDKVTEELTTMVTGTEEPITVATDTGEPVTKVTDEPPSTTEMQCPDVLTQYNLPCHCPFDAGIYHLPPTEFSMPDIGALKSFAQGDYTAYAQFYDMDTGELIACQNAQVSIANSPDTTPCTGLRCIFG